MDKLWSIHTVKCDSHKKERSTDTCHKVDEPQTWNVQREKLTKGHRAFDSIYTKCPAQANPERRKADQCLPGAGTSNARGFLLGGWKSSKSDCGGGCTTLNTQRTTEVHTLKGGIVWCVH